MDSHTHGVQVERLEAVDVGRRRRWSEEAKLKIMPLPQPDRFAPRTRLAIGVGNQDTAASVG
jgi:hypothetical protein